ncbi:MAG: hypothetical protein GEU73_13660, partial [Chloroflexi bacterium]|nr:hypothetical protein [Chloroflexota bacterium]
MTSTVAGDPTTTAQLAAFLARTTPPGAVRHVARRALATVLPLAAGAVDQAAPTHVLSVARAIEATGPAAVLGRTERLSPTFAALVNGTAANTDDYDDTDLETYAHPSAAVVPAALAAAEWRDAGFDDLLDATAMGIEVGVRLARALGSAHVDRGWHVSSTSGHVAAAAAAAAALDMRADDIELVLGLAATQVSGLGRALGTMTKPFHFGKAAANGVEAALLVSAGLTAPRTGIEGRRGLLAVVAPHADHRELVRKLGEHWLALQVMPKPYPCGFVSHPVIDAAIELAPQLPGTGDITAVEAYVHPACIEFMEDRQPRTALEAKLSAPFCVATALRRGRLGLAEFVEDAFGTPSTVSLMDRVRLVPEQRSPRSARL